MNLRGRVVDEETGTPLGYSSVGIGGQPVGTVTNEDGFFDFYFSNEYSHDSLYVSVLGYRRFTIQIAEISEPKNILIKLKIRPYVLDEVVITSSKLVGRDILMKAFEKVESNYPTKPYLMKAFFREIYDENDVTSFVLDASVDIYDTRGYLPVKGGKMTEKVDVRNVRASDVHFKSAIWRNHFLKGNYSYLANSIFWRSIKYRESWKKKLGAQKFEVDSLIYSDGRLFYRVSSPIVGETYDGMDTFFIDAETFAIKRHEYVDYGRDGGIHNEWKFVDDPSYLYRNMHRRVVQEFENYGGKLYPKYVGAEFIAIVHNLKTGKDEATIKTGALLVVSEVIDSDKALPGASVISYNESLIVNVKNYSSDFWKDYGDVKLFPLTKKQKDDLENESPLESQFQKSQQFKRAK